MDASMECLPWLTVHLFVCKDTWSEGGYKGRERTAARLAGGHKSEPIMAHLMTLQDFESLSVCQGDLVEEVVPSRRRTWD